MNLETISAIAQLTAAIGVIASLFYLAAQIRQNTHSQRSIVVDSLTHSLINLIGPQGSDLNLTRGFASAIEDWHGVTEEDRIRAIAVLFNTFKLFENAWFQQRQGTLDAEQWEGWDIHIRIYYHRPGVKIWWSLRRGMFAAGFRSYVEATKPVSDLAPLSRLISGDG
ncbi:MAG: hypothetical protein ABR514_09355 [Chthoniobacterales bacterium]